MENSNQVNAAAVDDGEVKMTENQKGVMDKLKKTSKGVKATIWNFVTILRCDENFADVRYNVLSSSLERDRDADRKEWTEVDNSQSLGYIEAIYGIYNLEKWKHALTQF